MHEKYTQLPLLTAIRELTLAQLVRLFANSHPAVLASVVRAKTRDSLRIVQH